MSPSRGMAVPTAMVRRLKKAVRVVNVFMVAEVEYIVKNEMSSFQLIARMLMGFALW